MARSCPWCGMESSNDLNCEWCRKALPSQTPDPPAVSDTDPGADEDETQFSNDPMVRFGYLAPMSRRLEWFFAVLFPATAILMFYSHLTETPGPIALVGCFVAGFTVSLYQLTKSVDDCFAPAGLALVLSLIIGAAPAFALFVCIAIAGRRQEASSVATLLAVYMIINSVIYYAAIPNLKRVAAITGWHTGVNAIHLSFVFVLAGWALANFWRPLNE